MDFLPVPTNSQGGKGCSRGPCCATDITSQCPSELEAPEGCNNACTVFKRDVYCCTGNSSNTCGPTNYSKFFKRICPDAYSNPKDDSTSVFNCPTGTNYMVVFCPSMNMSALAFPPDSNPTTPIGIEPSAANPPATIATEPTHELLILSKKRSIGCGSRLHRWFDCSRHINHFLLI